jgi:hypothetical protein
MGLSALLLQEEHRKDGTAAWRALRCRHHWP